MRVLIINDTTNWYHFGCTGTSTAIKNEIEKMGFNVSSFSIVDAGQLENIPTEANFFSRQGQEKFIISNPRFCDLVHASDIVIVNGEGTLHGPKKGPLTLLYMTHIAKNVFFKNVQIINHSVYPNDDLSIHEGPILDIYKKVYQAIDFSAIREPVSLEVMKKIGLSSQESFDCLPLYIKHYYKPKPINKQNDLILVSGSAAWFNKNIFTDDLRIDNAMMPGLEEMANTLKAKISDGYRVKFLYSDMQYPARDDQEMILELKRYMGPYFSVANATSVDDWLDHIAGAGLLISGRFHHSIAAACLGTKFIALNSNTPKMEGLMSSMGCPKPLLYSDQSLRLRLQDSIKRPITFANPSNIMDDLCKKAANNFIKLKKLRL